MNNTLTYSKAILIDRKLRLLRKLKRLCLKQLPCCIHVRDYNLKPRKFLTSIQRPKLVASVTEENQYTWLLRKLKRLCLKQLPCCIHVRDYNLKPRKFLTSIQRPKLVASVTEENQYTCLSDVVTPLWRIPYDEQLQMKYEVMKNCMKIPLNIIKNTLRDQQSVIDDLRDSSDGLICPFEEILPSPVVDGYRNKNATVVGTDINGNDKTVGLFVGKPSKGAAVTVNVTHLRNINEKAKESAMAFEDFLKQSSLPGTNQRGLGYCAVMRTNTAEELMLCAEFGFCKELWNEKSLRELRNRTTIFQGFKEKAEQELFDYFSAGAGRNAGVDSLYISTNHKPFKHLHGQTHIFEEMLRMKFRISPGSFFQINTRAAEILYSTIKDMSNINSSTVVLDVCCGTGTIGIILSKSAKQVIGVEMVPQAVEDAIYNAKLNGANNIEFVRAKAHQLLEPLSSCREFNIFDDVVAVVNPGRSGINKRVVDALRQSIRIRKLVYVSCKPVGNAAVNFVHLMMSESEEYPGKPFKPVKSKAIDMFPHTKHCELVVLFERCEGS